MKPTLGPRLAATLAIVVTATLATPSLASHVIVRPDGTGDFPTLNAAVHAMSSGYYGDTLQVEPGYYDEIVNNGNFFPCVIHGRAGPESTRVRGYVALPELSYEAGSSGAKAVGLTIEKPVAPGRNSSLLRWENCVFEGGFFGLTQEGRSPPVERCVFRDTSAFVGFGWEMRDCTFEGAPVYFENSIGAIKMLRCTFRGPAALLARVMPRDESNIVFEECSFSDAVDAVVVTPARYSLQFVDFWRCRFERLSGNAIFHKYGDPTEPEVGKLLLTLHNSVISDVGRVLQFNTAVMVILGMEDDTVRRVRDNAFEVSLRKGVVRGLRMSDVGGSGLVISNQNRNLDRFGYPPNEFWLIDNRIVRCGGDGIVIQ